MVDIGLKANDIASTGITRDWILPHAYVEMHLQPCHGLTLSVILKTKYLTLVISMLLISGIVELRSEHSFVSGNVAEAAETDVAAASMCCRGIDDDVGGGDGKDSTAKHLLERHLE